MTVLPRERLVGRQRELELLESHLAEAQRGRGAVVFLSGEPGIGKTRLAAELVDAARSRGLASVWGRCREDGGAPPYWPWVQAVRALVDGHEQLRASLGPAGEEVAALLAPDGSGSGTAFRLYEAVGAVLRAGAGTTGLLVVLDDLHRADDPSLRLLRYLAAGLAETPVLILACFRDTDLGVDHGLLGVIGSADPTTTSTLHLDGLEPHDVTELVGVVCGPDVAARLAPAVAARAGGNPLFALEISRLLQTGGPPAAARVPPTVREVIRHRVAGLPPETARALRTAAVLGRSFGQLPLAAVLECSELAAVAALQPAAAVHLLGADPEGQGSYRFTHAVVQESLYDELSVAERTSLHGRAADALADRGDLGDNVVSDIAFHRYQAAIGGDPGRAMADTLVAARRATARLAHDEASRWFSLALDLGLRSQDCDTLSLLLEAGDAAVRAGQRQVARARYEPAAALASERHDHRALARAALGVGTTVVTAGTVDWPLVDLLEHAEHLAGPDPALRAELLSRRAIELYWEEPADARRRSGEALEVAEGSGDEHAVGVALHARQFTLRGPDGLTERIAIGRRLAQLATRLGDLDLAFEGHTWLAADVLRASDMAGFLAELDSLEQVAQRSREPLHRWYAMVYRAELAAIRGRLDEARRLTEEAAALGARLEVAVSEGYRVAQLAVLARDTGTLADVESDLRQAIERLPYFPTLKATLALVLAEGGHAAAARAEIHQLSPGRFAAIPPDSLWTTSVALLGEAAAIVGSPHLAVLAELVEPHSGEILVHGIPACWGATDRVRGVLAAAAGRWSDADIALAAALAAHEALGAPGWVARTKLDQARVAAMDGRPAAAVAAAREASAEAAALGLHGIARAADRLLSEVVDPQVRLSRREREVLTLLATGAANKEIAASLVVSVHTVERHLANIYTKIGARSRSEATAFAVRHGLA